MNIHTQSLPWECFVINMSKERHLWNDTSKWRNFTRRIYQNSNYRNHCGNFEKPHKKFAYAYSHTKAEEARQITGTKDSALSLRYLNRYNHPAFILQESENLSIETCSNVFEDRIAEIELKQVTPQHKQEIILCAVSLFFYHWRIIGSVCCTGAALSIGAQQYYFDIKNPVL